MYLGEYVEMLKYSTSEAKRNTVWDFALTHPLKLSDEICIESGVLHSHFSRYLVGKPLVPVVIQSLLVVL